MDRFRKVNGPIEELPSLGIYRRCGFVNYSQPHAA